MPTPERYYKEQIQRAEEAERRATRDTRREWARVLSEMLFWTLLGLLGLGLAFHALDVDRGFVYWWAGAFVWTAGVFVAVITAYLRGVRRGDWR